MADAKTIYDLPSPTQDKLLSEFQEELDIWNAGGRDVLEVIAQRWLNIFNKKRTINTLLTHEKLNRKLKRGVHPPKLEKIKAGIEDYRKYLHPITDEELAPSSKEVFHSKVHLIYNPRLIAEGGDPLIPEIEGGLSLRFIYENITNSGAEPKKKSCHEEPFFENNRDSGRTVSNVLLRVYRVVNNC